MGWFPWPPGILTDLSRLQTTNRIIVLLGWMLFYNILRLKCYLDYKTWINLWNCQIKSLQLQILGFRFSFLPGGSLFRINTSWKISICSLSVTSFEFIVWKEKLWLQYSLTLFYSDNYKNTECGKMELSLLIFLTRMVSFCNQTGKKHCLGIIKFWLRAMYLVITTGNVIKFENLHRKGH